MLNRHWGRILRQATWIASLLAALVAAPAMAACSASGAANDLGSFSPAALKAVVGPPSVIATPYVPGLAGFGCTSASVLTLSLSNFLKATIPTGTVLRLSSTVAPTEYVPVTLFAKADGTSPIVAGTTFTFFSGLSLDLLGLSGGAMTVPLYFKLATPSGSPPVKTGTYTATFPIKWEWYFCPGVYLFGCSVADDGGTVTAKVTMTLVVAAKPPVTSVSSLTTYDPVSDTVFPKALPGSRRRTTITVTNPDLVSLATGSVEVMLSTAALTELAIDGDGTGGALVQTSQGSPASGLVLNYVSPTDGGDEVDFSTNGGFSWSAAPTVGTQGTINRVRFRPHGTMAPGSSFNISIPYLVKPTP